MSIDLSEEFEAAFEAEPPLRSTELALVAGQGALRRRRLAMGTAAAVVVAGVALASNQLTDDTAGQQPPVEQPKEQTPGDIERQLTDSAVIDTSWQDDCGLVSQPSCEEYVAAAAPVGIDQDGQLLRISEDVVIVKQEVDATPPGGSFRMEVEVRTPLSVQPKWWVLTRDAEGTLTAELTVSHSAIPFERWARALNDDRDAKGAPLRESRPVIIG